MEMADIIFKIFLFTHIVSGSVALFTGSVALILKKKRGLHSKFGFIFHFAMIAIAISAFVMAIMHTNYFLFVIGVFSLYLSFAGYRSIKFMGGFVKPSIIDKLIMILSTFLLFGVSYQYLSTSVFKPTGFSTVLLFFDIVFVVILLKDLEIFKINELSKNDFLIRHITRMVPAYIATVTAFLVVNVNYQYPVVIWLAPTFLFLPVIICNIRKYRKKVVL
jgi:uncharacterized membrane protein